jgi:transglutaminase-like putative cysteine protease
MLPLLLRVIGHFRPREGWTLALLSLVALLCAPAAMLVLDAKLGGEGLLLLTVLAAILGLRLARSRLAAGAAAVLAILLGGGLVTLIVGRLFPPLSLLWSETLNAIHWLSHVQQGSAGQPLPFATAAAYIWQRLADLGVRLWWWGQTAAGGGTARDPIVLALVASFLVWAIGFFAAWQIYRRRSVLVGLVPSGVALATVSFFGGGLTLFYLIVYLFCTLGLVAGWHLWLQQDRWQQTGIDYPGDLGTELILNLAPAIVLVLALAAIFPVVGPRQVRDAFWKVMDRPWSAVEQASERLFGPIEHAGSGGRGGRSSGIGGTLPRSHLLGGGSELSETIVLYVKTNDPPPPRAEEEEPRHQGLQPPRRYWRSATYDTYTGRGWSNGPLEERTSPPDQPLETNLPPGADLVQQFDLLLPEADAVYAVNAPWQVDRAVQTWWRAPGDLAQVTGSARQYVAISRPPDPTVADLRQASTFLPPEIAERYLALPESVPQRVQDLARQVVGDQDSRYDQALAIETYLRAYTYTLDLPEPPAGRDLVDYFLFDLQKGYCDYYASAMVVIARSAGIPARLAIGYAQGTYDYDRERWVATEQDGHTWAEVYFDGIGWVEFEPTAGLPALERPGGEGLPGPAVPPLPARPLRWWQRVPWALGGMGLILILAMALVFRLWRPRQQPGLAARDLARDRYARLLQWGARLKYPPRDGETASEYGASLSQALRARGQNARLFQVRRASVKAPAEVERLTGSFVRAQYDSTPLSDREGWQIHDLWTRLRRRLWWLWLSRR